MSSARLLTDVSEAARLLREGGLVAFATETVYGLGANALDPHAVARVFEAKQRPHFDPLIVHLADAADLESIVVDVPPLARKLIERFWPGPLTLVLPKREQVPDLVTSGLPTVAVRVPDHGQARELIRQAGVPVAAPSANPFGRISPTRAEHVLEQLGDRIDAVLDGGPCRVGVESTVLEIRDQAPPRLLRPGGLTVEEIESVTGHQGWFPQNAGLAADEPPSVESRRPERTALGERALPSGSADVAQASPGMLEKHYAPGKPLVVVNRWEEALQGAGIGVLAFQEVAHPERFGRVEVLSPSGSLAEAAANFFAALRRLDADPDIRQIVASRFPEEGLGWALNDRLQRASAE